MIENKNEIKLGLTVISKLLEKLSNPEKKLKIIHVAGTNGKGSTCMFITKMLMNMGYSVGLYTSPYLVRINESIKLNLKDISDDELKKTLLKVNEAANELQRDSGIIPTEFEILTAIMYLYFANKNVDFAVVEVGLGGRLDATNTCEPILSVITSIGFDHTNFLGNILEKIATEKAGIIKPGTPAVLYKQDEMVENVIKNTAKEKNANIFVTNSQSIIEKSSENEKQVFELEVFGEKFSDIKLSAQGRHQIRNFETALTSIKILENGKIIKRVPRDAIYRAAFETVLKARLEIMCNKPLTIVDGAHNFDGMSMLVEYIKTKLKDKKILLVLGMLKDKEVEKISELLKPHISKYVLTKPSNERALNPEELAKIISENVSLEKIRIVENIEQAVEYSQEYAKRNDMCVIYAGSLYMTGRAGEILKRY